MGARGMIAGLGVKSELVDVDISFHLLDSQLFLFLFKCENRLLSYIIT